MEANSLWMGLLWGSIGAGYFIYGKKQNSVLLMLLGFCLCVLPYLVGNLVLQNMIALALTGSPWLIKKYL
ncbi:hypothetical protein COW36_22580 [bacterium (Candidatus Blackallbacteria) CG17_big_fil_post_rev_8_21_14_2_50_48_46]|uniref:Amino acid transport protein n=1 Tax=bacterium (Candidatus Blackallbacteria) CG17_big_fil_post_rev_8_21_14_2_50_48_46 TaxID=2014261 RepID=A0A2M7FYD7_9BACT|nr:MAG: hypothetical protein COW64_07350 [bacterium (Candidatus Blackallbacteria) CG18_big_fil_WC_8_21_14_2_50_49_26]PIW14166.1 MAG: hypothetical protein COW36_22580 [bacterium (Candidatus Blackallbacteria) CG17_big_fil_post_rev_8_21_14_2_50_48_46]PIW46707.1 MAG: hypothetical protein COW20_14855 [bacterium (Candidatus Blackallbacteria) CG13_big_fil_rev_8_21_14_2_50_49_14]